MSYQRKRIVRGCAGEVLFFNIVEIAERNRCPSKEKPFILKASELRFLI